MEKITKTQVNLDVQRFHALFKRQQLMVVVLPVGNVPQKFDHKLNS